MGQSSLDTKQHDAYFKDLARRLNADLPRVVDAETASILKATAAQHKPTKKGKLRTQTTERVMSSGDVGDSILTVNLKNNRGRVWYTPSRSASNKVWYLVGNWPFKGATYQPSSKKFPAEIHKGAKKAFREYRKQAREAVKTGTQSRGLSGQSWVQANNKIGFSTAAIGPASAKVNPAVFVARPRDGRRRNNVAVYRYRAGEEYTLTIINRSPTTIRSQGRKKLQKSIRTRRAFFKNNLKRGVFNTAQTAAKAYPGIYAR